MTATSPETTQSTAKKNSFESTLKHFSLTDNERVRVLKALRAATVYRDMSVPVSARRITPDTSEMTPEEKQAIWDEVDAANAVRTEKVRAFLAGFLPADVALLLAKKMKSYVKGIVVVHAPSDEHFTMYAERL